MLNSDPCNKVFVQVVYALPQKQYLFEVELAQGASVKEAIIQSPILTLCPQIDINTCKIGIYSRIVKLTDEVKNGDRVEIYRSLIADPKELRRMRAKNAGTNQAQE